MQSLLNQKGDFRVVIGEGMLSLFEAANLETGQVIRVTREAGQPFNATFNGTYLCSGELVIIFDIFGFRITSTSQSETPQIHKGIVEDITEMLPFQLQLQTVRYSLEELRGISRQSVIHLDQTYDRENHENIELYIAGIHAASGKLMFIEEYFAIEITQVHIEIKTSVPIPARTSGFIHERDDIIPKIYDFTRPDKFTFRHIMHMKQLHSGFLKNLHASVPGMNEIELKFIDQLCFEECKMMVADVKEKINFVVIHGGFRQNESLVSPEKLSDNPETLKTHLISDSAQYPFNDEQIKTIESFMSMRQPFEKKMLMFVDRSLSLNDISDTSAFDELVLQPLRNSWKSVADISIKTARINTPFEEIDIIPNADMILVAAFGKPGSKDILLLLVYPYIFLEPMIGLLG